MSTPLFFNLKIFFSNIFNFGLLKRKKGIDKGYTPMSLSAPPPSLLLNLKFFLSLRGIVKLDLIIEISPISFFFIIFFILINKG